MTTDIPVSASAHLVLVRNRAGVREPFSIEALATSILVAGVDTPRAFQVAADVERSLQQQPDFEVSSRSVAERVAARLEACVGATEADRYMAWRRFRQGGRPLVLCLLGAPGVGKSTVATRLAPRFGVRRVVPTDGLREVLRTVIPAEVLPDLHRAAHDVVEGGGADGFDRQARAVGAASIAVAERMVGEGRSVILVGSHLLPGAVRTALQAAGSNAFVLELLLTLQDEALHHATMMRRTRSDPAHADLRHVQNFSAVRKLQEHLLHKARAAGIPWLDVADPSGLTQWIVDHVVASTASATD